MNEKIDDELLKKYNESFNKHGYRLVNIKTDMLLRVLQVVLTISLILYMFFFGGSFLYLASEGKFGADVTVNPLFNPNINVTDVDTTLNTYNFTPSTENNFEINLDLSSLECINFT